MAWHEFAQWYDTCPDTDRTHLRTALRLLTEKTIIWRGADQEQETYDLLERWEPWVKECLAFFHWSLQHYPTLQIMQIISSTGHSKPIWSLSLPTMKLLLILAMIYDERGRSRFPSLHDLSLHQPHYPCVCLYDVHQRYLALFPQKLSRREMHEAYKTLADLKCLRPLSKGGWHFEDVQQSIELLPPLELALIREELLRFSQQLVEQNPANSQYLLMDQAIAGFDEIPLSLPDLDLPMEESF